MNVEAAVADALAAGKALCKIISRNDVGATGGHQCGFYLPKSVWRMFTPQPPEKGVNHKSEVRIQWPEDIATDSVVDWYGKGTRSEYRLTRFGREFPWLKEEYVGSLLVLIPVTLNAFKAHILETEDEIQTFEASLGVETLGGWALFSGGRPKIETEDECLKRIFAAATEPLAAFPDGAWMAKRARDAVQECSGNANALNPDARLLKWVAAEYQLFRTVENKLCMPAIQREFPDVDAFINVAATVMNRRKSRAGHSLEHHVEEILRSAEIKFDRQPRVDGKIRPDILIPGKAAYDDPAFPVSRLVVVGLKTTCKDRWRQVLSEGKRVPEKHLLTLQEAISSEQLTEMRDANVTLVVPQPYHKGYDVSTGIRLLTIDQFVTKIKSLAT